MAYQWSKDPGFSHLKAEEIRQGIKQIRDSSGKSASEQNATAEQVATVGRMAQNEATEVVTALAKTKADHAKEIAALRTNLSQAQEDIASLQDSPENLGSEIPAIKEDLLQVRDILSDLQNGAYTAANEMTTLRSITVSQIISREHKSGRGLFPVHNSGLRQDGLANTCVAWIMR